MRCLGIDLAAQPKSTAICLTSWEEGKVAIEDLRCGLNDEGLVDSMLGADRVGLDAPLGWPDDFIQSVGDHHDQRRKDPLPDRRLLTLRETDRRLQQETGRRPLSVSTDLIGVVALRAVDLQTLMAARGRPVDRTGDGHLCEVYPAAALESWGIDATGYKSAKGRDRLPGILESLEAGIGEIDFGEADRSALERDHNQLDALICSLIARAAALGATSGPDRDDAAKAAREGWIHVPEIQLGDLRSGA
jgi:predicted nuclease with RNAse H fold